MMGFSGYEDEVGVGESKVQISRANLAVPSFPVAVARKTRRGDSRCSLSPTRIACQLHSGRGQVGSKWVSGGRGRGRGRGTDLMYNAVG